jgi:RNA polymerase sigma factor (sigma-70 family)
MDKETSSRFHTDGDAGLLHLMALQDDSAYEAWDEFYARHVTYLYGICAQAFTKIVGPHKIEDIVQDTFVRAFQRAAQFSLEGNIAPADERRLVRGWLGKISENIVRDYFRGQPEVDFVDEQALEIYEAARQAGVEEIGNNESGDFEQMENAFETLTEDEKHVLRTTGLWYKPGQKQQRLPNSVMVELAASLNTNATNVRKIRSRGIAKVKSFFESLPENTKS